MDQSPRIRRVLIVADDDFAGQIVVITDCVLQTAVQQLSVWHQNGMPFRVSVNITPSLVSDPEFPERLSRLVAEYDVPPAAAFQVAATQWL